MSTTEISFPIDLVVPYVNNRTEEWLNTYQEFCKKIGALQRVDMYNSERYRDWGYFKYFMRGVMKNMPFINRVFLILQDVDQIPWWLDKDSVTIIYHRDFIPEQFLPTYNSTTFEMFLDNIPGLSEHFIYANDDMYPLNPLKASDFFTPDGKIRMGFRKVPMPKEPVQFDIVCQRCYDELRAGLQLPPIEDESLRPFHELTPMILSHLKIAKGLLRDGYYSTITPFRAPYNYNQYIYPLYELLTNNAAPSPRTYVYANMEDKTEQVSQVITNADANVFVLNDNHCTDVKLWSTATQINQAFETRFPLKCKYERKPLVSVCIPVYNAEKFIERCLDSIPQRDDIEIVIVDDKSTDGTLDIIKKKASSFKDIVSLFLS